MDTKYKTPLTDSPFVSVIVPVYNGEKHLRQCVESIVDQTLTNIEIFFIDDGSTDSSFSILEEYRSVDSRIHVLQQNHGYAGTARNTGKGAARGKYLMFWDCDDFFELTALETLYNLAESCQADIAICGANQFYEELGESFPTDIYVRTARLPEHSPFNRKTNPDHILDFTNEAAWNKMFLRSFVEEKQLDFQPVRNGNDVFFVVCALCLAERIATTTERLVTYRKNQKTGLVGTISQSNSSPFRAWMDSARYLESKGVLPERSFANKAISSAVYLLRNMQDLGAFHAAVELLKHEGLETLHLVDHEPDYFYVDWHYDVIEHLQGDDPDIFLMYLAHLTYIQMTEKGAKIQRSRFRNRKLKNELNQTKEDLRNTRKEIERIKSSRSYKLARRLRGLFGAGK